ncbi:hypothetical protein Ocin01_09846 [Orchesella cincta]|uniref:Uncharacterized protein n=1 Tax=Orchesella cincta TaxID=48709 RepID=A0A1D2MV98_ORCCI|nr:hypothetical protein Ocin01_09846 [Orchesella cincta]
MWARIHGGFIPTLLEVRVEMDVVPSHFYQLLAVWFVFANNLVRHPPQLSWGYRELREMKIGNPASLEYQNFTSAFLFIIVGFFPGGVIGRACYNNSVSTKERSGTIRFSRNAVLAERMAFLCFNV